MIPESFIQDLLDRVDIVDLIDGYVRLKKAGANYSACCPFHNEKTPSFSVEPDRKFFYCFGCNKGGGLVSFLMEVEKLSYPEAVEALAKKLGIPVEYEGEGAPRRDTSEQDRLEQLSELYRRVAVSFHHILAATESGSDARAYLERRGISEEMVRKFRLGYAPADRSWLFKFLVKKGYSEEFLASSGLFSQKNGRSSFFADRLMFPIADRRGLTVAFGARLLHGEGPKYLNSSESDLYRKRETLYAVDLAMPEIRRTKEVYLCEGYMDVIALHQAGVANAVAPLGTAFTEEQAKLLRRWAERAYLIFDSDEAGARAAVKGILTCRAAGLSCAVVDVAAGSPASAGFKDPSDLETLSGFKDPADILRDAGAEALQKTVKCFINDFDYLVGRARSSFDMSSAEGVAQATAFLFPYLETLDSEVSRDGCVGAIADAFGVDRAAVRRDFLNRHAAVREKAQGPASSGARPTVRMNDELFLLIAVVVNRSLYGKLRAALSVEEVEDPRAKELFIALEECFRNDSDDMDALLARLGDEELRAFVIEKSASEAFTIQGERLVADGISRIKAKRLERRRAEIVLALRTARNEGGGIERALDDLLSEKVHIDEELRRLKEDHE